MERKIKVITLCSGYDSQCMALERIRRDFGIDYELVAWSEIDKYAIQAHDACFPEYKGRNLGDMTMIDWTQIKEDIDLLVYSTPCQSISNAGLQHGFKRDSGTRSSIIWSTLDAIDALRPRYLLLENVKAMVSQKFMPDFKLWCGALEERGYTNHWQVLNAKEYGVPQNRERVFMLSTRDGEHFEFPKGFELKKRLKDVLEENVDERYYLREKLIERIFIDFQPNSNEEIKVIGNTNPSGHGIGGQVYSTDGLAPTITTNKGEGPRIMETVKPKRLFNIFGKVNSSQDGIILSPEGISKCLTSGHNNTPKILESKSIISKETKYGNKRVQALVDSGKIKGDRVQFLDAYNQSVSDDIAGIIRTTIDSSNMHFITEPQVLTPKRTEYGKKVRKEYESGNLQESRHNMTELRPREDGICNTLITVQKDNLLVEPFIKQYPRGFNDGFEYKDGYAPTVTRSSFENNNFVVEPTLKIPQATEKGYVEVKPGSIFDGSYPESKTRRGRVQGDGQICPTITANGEPLNYYGYDFRIRKLSERECFRLMDVEEGYIDRIQDARISRTQQYKLAGNSIVVSCLYYIFKNLFIGYEKTTLF